METKAVKVVVTAQPDGASSPLDEDTSGPDLCDPMQEFSRRLEAIISSYGAAASSLPDKQSSTDTETEKTKEGTKEDVTVTMETDISLIMQSLSKSSSSEEKLGDLVRKYAELATLRRCDERKLCVLQQKMWTVQEERKQLQAERRSSVAARSKLETLCRDLQSHYTTLREETLQRCREDEEKRSEITCHFQKMLKEIQTQIEQHSARNDKLCHENANLTDKLESLMNQCDRREESLEKIDRHRELQHKLTDAKLQEANALLTQAEEKHKREKEYLLREAIDKTKKCFAMKEQELAMKKKLTLYGEKFDEFQATLAKSNEIYMRFKKEMDNMSDKMKTMEKESNVWKTRFENCNKALTDMIQERTEKAREYDQFVVTIHKLERLCRVLQEERTVLYDKIKGIRQSNSQLPAKLFDSLSEAADKPVLLTPVELQEDDPVLTEDMARLRQEQAKLQEFADSLFAAPADVDQDAVDTDLNEDEVASAFANFKTKPQVQQEPASEAEQEVEADVSLQDKVEPVQKPDVSTAGEVEVKPEEEHLSAQEPAAAVPEKVENHPATEPEAEMLKTPAEVRADEPVQATTSESPSENTTAASNADSSKKQAPKKKKKRSGKNNS
ncbi:beta-taxilin isoform X3 [Hippoglossus hippoglossus]|uniref:beta-taxilin isoform X3 n=1 Tax=Hippoglossus hippoglossus TaxID=8267 RepID=UPI00148D4E62|nr:beta-taxilin isoform X3 [Hippoglossus hippoglossus]